MCKYICRSGPKLRVFQIKSNMAEMKLPVNTQSLVSNTTTVTNICLYALYLKSFDIEQVGGVISFFFFNVLLHYLRNIFLRIYTWKHKCGPAVEKFIYLSIYPYTILYFSSIYTELIIIDKNIRTFCCAKGVVHIGTCSSGGARAPVSSPVEVVVASNIMPPTLSLLERAHEIAGKIS